MYIRNIEDLVYVFKKAKQQKAPAPIVFIGAGASYSAGIPLADQIRQDVLRKYFDKPSISKLNKDELQDYYQVMNALSPDERRNLFYDYISAKSVKVNVTHIYLAQLIKEGYVDYVLTPNFDDLLLKACALFNFLPPVYDASNLNEFTTTTFRNHSLIYLHGQYHGQWLLNAKGELEKIKNSVPKIFERICSNRTWVIVGYSGQDGLLDEIVKIGSFENELYWIGYENFDPSDNVKEKLLNNTTANAYLVKGNTSDSFFLKLHAGLSLHTPEIFNKSFSFLENLLNNIKDIDCNNSEKDLFRNVADRLQMTRKWVLSAINRFENTNSIDLTRQNIIEDILKKNFENLNEYLKLINDRRYVSIRAEVAILLNNSILADYNKVKAKDDKFLKRCIRGYKKAIALNPKMAVSSFNAGVTTSELAEKQKSPKLYSEALNYFEKAINLDPNHSEAYMRWGDTLFDYASLWFDETLFIQSFRKYRKAIQINPKLFRAYLSWAIALRTLANIKHDATLFKQSIAKYKVALKLQPGHISASSGLARATKELAFLSRDLTLFKDALDLFKKCNEINPDSIYYVYQIGNCLVQLGRMASDINVLLEAEDYIKSAYERDTNKAKANGQLAWYYFNLGMISKNTKDFNLSIRYGKKAIALNKKMPNVYYTISSAMIALLELDNLKPEIELLKKPYQFAKRSHELGGPTYNLACISALMDKKKEAFEYLKLSVEKKEKTKSEILKDSDWLAYINDKEFRKIISSIIPKS